ncbi:MAG: class I SAM-dependent methyltransferase [Alphaproteobacteria bacterium]|nr:class I SAM-dependent methyltransferase [Alphaproteobacteria bacterium]
MTRLLEILRDTIAGDGPISIAQYMELALQHPDYGYYRHSNPLGAKGDFTTAPEISQMFGELIGLWCADMWRQMGQPSSFLFLELGPGRGTLMQDALRATAKIQGFHAALHLWLLESNETLRKLQEKKLADFHPEYLENLADLPSRPLIFIANEFFDALPIRQFIETDNGLCERMVDFVDGKLVFSIKGADDSGPSIRDVSNNKKLPRLRETSPHALTFMKMLAAHAAKRGGGGLVIDYGYVEPSGDDTLQAVSKHEFANVLERPGEVDLTAHVDFGALRLMAEKEGTRVAGPVGQGEFLTTLGIELRALQLKHGATEAQCAAVDSALHRLVDPAEMGALFKVMGVTSPHLKECAGFS